MNVSNRVEVPFVPAWKPILAVAVGFASVFLIASAGHEAKDLPAAWLATALQPEVGLYLLWLVSFPLAFFLGPKRSATGQSESPSPPSLGARIMVSVGAGLVSMGIAAYFGWDLAQLPPLLHDEYSYLVQAETFRAGRLSWPTPPAVEHFRQIHVLSADGVWASRYFPATGLWIAPFLAVGIPAAAGWVAQGVTVAFIVAAASRYSMRAALIAGAILATAPFLVVFSNSYLSPHPTMMGLAIAWWAFQESFIARSRTCAVITGVAMGWAFLARPLTAAAIGAPWALYALGQLAQSRSRPVVLAMSLAFAPAPMLLAAYNHSLTGSPWVTPYGEYTALYTPSHVFGFYNKTRGLGERTFATIVPYDDWVEELTLARAVGVTIDRWESAAIWMGGLVPTLILAFLSLLLLPSLGNAGLLPLLSVVGLSAAYFPFFYPGILGFSYVLEGLPFLILVMSIAMARTSQSLRSSTQPALATCWSLLVLLVAAGNVFIAIPTALAPSGELVYPRLAATERAAKEERLAADGPILILYDVDWSHDLHTTWVHNHPSFAGPIIRAFAHDHPDEVLQAFPGRRAFLFRNGEYRQIR